MRTVRWSILCFAGAVAATVGAAWADIVRLEPPFGWEDRVTPGYDPSVESVVVRMFRGELQEPEQRAALWATWDSGAVDILTRMIGDEFWKNLQSPVVQLLAASPHEAARAWFENTLHALAQKSDASTDDTHFFYMVAGALPKEQRAKWIDVFLEEGAKHARQWALTALLSTRTPESFARAEQVVAAEQDESTRKSWEEWLDGWRGYLRAQEPMEVAK